MASFNAIFCNLLVKVFLMFFLPLSILTDIMARNASSRSHFFSFFLNGIFNKRAIQELGFHVALHLRPIARKQKKKYILKKTWSNRIVPLPHSFRILTLFIVDLLHRNGATTSMLCRASDAIQINGEFMLSHGASKWRWIHIFIFQFSFQTVITLFL